jgi:EmrB/QacA subfamily drug resistance transporter
MACRDVSGRLRASRQFFQIDMLVIVVVLLGMLCAAMETLINVTIAPTIIADLGEMELYPWISNAFLLSFLVMTPIYGKLSDTYGYKQIYIVSLVIFMIASLLCGSAQTMLQLIIFRALQGCSAAGIITMSIVLFGVLFPLEKRSNMQALLSSMWALASIIGPFVGAFFVQTLTWRWAFYFNIPISLVILWAIYGFLKVPHQKHKQISIDLLGGCLFLIGACSLIYGLINVSKLEFSPMLFFTLIVGIVFLTLFVIHSLKIPQPLIPLRLLSSRIVLVAVSLGCLGGFFLFCAVSFLPMYIQGVLGKTAKVAGEVLIAMAFGNIVGSFLSGGLLNRLGFRTISLIGTFLLTIGFTVLIFLPDTKTWQLASCNFLIGAGVSAVANSSIIAVQAASPREMIGSATSLYHFFRGIGSIACIAVLGGIQLGSFRRGLEAWEQNSSIENPTIRNFMNSPQKIFDFFYRSQLSSDELRSIEAIFANSIEYIFVIGAILGLLAIAVAYQMLSERPKDFVVVKK